MLLVLFCIWNISHFRLSTRVSHNADATRLPCSRLPGADSTLVVLRTGATELEARLPAHLSTTLRCYPHHVIFSDYQETFPGKPILDALEFVSPEIKASNADFELYRRLQQGGRAGLNASELSDADSKPVSLIGNTDNPGWKLDKWKFLPIVNQTLYLYPKMKWYVFAEADTFMLWSTLLAYTAAMNPDELFYVGSQTMVGSFQIAHGGSAFVVSQPALRRVVER